MDSKRTVVFFPKKMLDLVEQIAAARFSSRGAVLRELVAAALAERTKRASA